MEKGPWGGEKQEDELRRRERCSSFMVDAEQCSASCCWLGFRICSSLISTSTSPGIIHWRSILWLDKRVKWETHESQRRRGVAWALNKRNVFFISLCPSPVLHKSLALENADEGVGRYCINLWRCLPEFYIRSTQKPSQSHSLLGRQRSFYLSQLVPWFVFFSLLSSSSFHY